jgi:hypothetical protein
MYMMGCETAKKKLYDCCMQHHEKCHRHSVEKKKAKTREDSDTTEY